MNKEVTGEHNNVKIDDEIGQDLKNAQIESLLKEYKHFASTVKEKEEELKEAEHAQKVDVKAYELVLEGDNCRKVRPEFRYEELDEYWVLRKQQTEIQKVAFLRKSEKAISQLKASIAAMKAQMDSSSKKILELGGKLE